MVFEKMFFNLFLLLLIQPLMSDTNEKNKKTMQTYNKVANDWVTRYGIKGTDPSLWFSYIDQFQKELSSSASLLDIGFGGGRESRIFIGKGYNVTGVDPCKTFVVTMQNHFPKHTFVEGSLDALPFKDNSFDAVWCTSVLLHIAEEKIPQALKQIYRVLKPGGKLLLSFSQGSKESKCLFGRWFFVHPEKEFTDALKVQGFTLNKIEQVPNQGKNPWEHQSVVFAQK